MIIPSFPNKHSLIQWPNYNLWHAQAAQCGRKIRRILDYHTDTISSLGILVVTTGILAAKIFRSMPQIIGSSGRLFLEFSGIIWLNVQLKEFSKSKKDWTRAIHDVEYAAIVRTTVKVIIKAVNILLTCAYFGASITTFGGFPQCSAAIYMTLRPLSLGILTAEIANDICDYITNKGLLKKFAKIESQDHAGHHLAKIMCSYLKINLRNENKIVGNFKEELNDKKVASSIIRQLDTFTISMLQENLSRQLVDADPHMKALNLYYSIKEGLGNTQARVISNLSLTALAYFSRAICKLYPDTLTEMLARWSMSVLFTDELVIKYKLRQMDLNHL